MTLHKSRTEPDSKSHRTVRDSMRPSFVSVRSRVLSGKHRPSHPLGLVFVMKRSSSSNGPSKKAKIMCRAQPDTLPHYYADWPAPKAAMDAARTFIRECASNNHLTLLVPDKDADGLSSGKIMHQTLTALGLSSTQIEVHMPAKASSIFQPAERTKMEAHGATRVIVIDQGSRGGPPLLNTTTASGEQVKTLILDHHESDVFPEGALVVSACRSPPVATSSLLTYLVCLPLHESVRDDCAIPALLGVFGDLGSTAVKWGEGPWPAHLGDVMKRVSKKALSEAVSMMNAPRRTAEYQGRHLIVISLCSLSVACQCTRLGTLCCVHAP